MPDGTALNEGLVYVFEPTFAGLMSAVFEAFAHRPMPAELRPQGCQQRFDCVYREVDTQPEKALRVQAGVRQRMGKDAYEMIWDAFLHEDEDCGNAIYHYLRLGFAVGAGIRLRLSDDRVLAVQKRAKLVEREAGFLLEFIRFAELSGGIWFSEITPEYAVLPLIMPHFVSRYHVQPFMIYDKTHRQAGVYDRREWYIREAEDGLVLPARTESEEEMRRLWKRFYDTVAIESRVNPALRRQLMPKKYWKNMVEMRPVTLDNPPSLAYNKVDKILEKDGTL